MPACWRCWGRACRPERICGRSRACAASRACASTPRPASTPGRRWPRWTGRLAVRWPPRRRPRHAVEGADVIVTATSSSTPVLEHAWIAPGAHINAVGASTPGARELPVETLAAAALFADSRESLRQEAGDFRAALERGLIDEQHVRGELGQVLAGTAPGRREAGEITLFRSLGLAVEDLAAARLALGEAARRGIGTEVKL